MASEVFLAIIQDNFATLRHFRGESSLATYLTVVARRVVVPPSAQAAICQQLVERGGTKQGHHPSDGRPSMEEHMSNREEVERLLASLDAPEADVVRLYHLEGKSYREISSQVGMPENSVGPTLSQNDGPRCVRPACPTELRFTILTRFGKKNPKLEIRNKSK